MNLLASIRSIGKHSYQPDLRSLAFMRIALALVILTDLCIRLTDFTAHYTDAGVWPKEMLSQGWKTGYWTFHTLFAHSAYLAFLFICHLLLAISFLIGAYTRLSTFLLLVFYISLHNRNIFILQAGDDLLRLTLLSCLFLPVGARYSVDVMRNKARSAIPVLAFPAYLLLISSVYIFSVLLKDGPDWRINYDAVYYALNLSQLRLPLGDWLLQQQALLQPLTLLVLGLEASIPILILWPAKSGRTRLLALLLILLLQFAFGLTLFVGLFWLISIACSLALLPASAAERIEKFAHLPRQSSLPATTNRGFLNLVCLFLAILSLAVNLSTLRNFSYEISNPLIEVVNALRLDQYWGMFSPGVLRKDGYLVYHGMDAIGRQWDLRRDEDYVDYHEPAHIVDLHRNDRWRKWTENMQDDRFTFLRPLYCQYTIRQFNAKAKKRKVQLLKLYWVQKETQPSYQPAIRKEILYCICNED